MRVYITKDAESGNYVVKVDGERKTIQFSSRDEAFEFAKLALAKKEGE